MLPITDETLSKETLNFEKPDITNDGNSQIQSTCCAINKQHGHIKGELEIQRSVDKKQVKNTFIMKDQQGKRVAKAELRLPKGTRFKIIKFVPPNAKPTSKTIPLKDHLTPKDEGKIQPTDKEVELPKAKYKITRPGHKVQLKCDDKWLQKDPSTHIATKDDKVQYEMVHSLHLENDVSYIFY